MILVLVAIALAALISRGDDRSPHPAMASSGPGDPLESGTPPSPTETADAQLALPITSDPEEFAEAVAGLVLGMDPGEHSEQWYRRVLEDALDEDVLDEDLERLRAATLSWIPDDEAWRRQADLEQSTSFTPQAVTEPSRTIFADDAPEGHEVRTVTGEQVVSYLAENGRRAKHSQKRELSVWMFCPPDEPCGLVAIPREVLR